MCTFYTIKKFFFMILVILRSLLVESKVLTVNKDLNINRLQRFEIASNFNINF